MSDKIKEIQERCKERAGNIHQPELGPQYQLPLWGEHVRAIPNPLTRSNLFAPISRGKRKVHRETELARRNGDDFVITYSGDQLDEADRDVFLQLYHVGRNTPLGEVNYITKGRLLVNLGRVKSKTSYKWLEDSLKRLFMGALFIRTKRYSLGKTKYDNNWIHLIDRPRIEHSIENDESGDAIGFAIDPRIVAMFENNEFTLVDWEKRLQIEHKVDTAKWLQCYICSHEKKKIQRHNLIELKKLMSYESPIRKFREAISDALDELKRIKVVDSVESNKLIVPTNVWVEKSTRGEEQIIFIRL